jgi:hypothetical protein
MCAQSLAVFKTKRDKGIFVNSEPIVHLIIQRSRLTMAKENNAPVVVDEEEAPPDMSLKDITDGDNGRGIPAALFVEDITSFAESFKPHAKAELLIGAYTQLHTKYKSSEASLKNKRKLRSLAGY